MNKIRFKRAPQVCARTGAVVEKENVYQGRQWVAQHITMSAPDLITERRIPRLRLR